MPQYRPGSTATPPSGETHWVIRGDRAAPATWRYLPVPSSPKENVLPLWRLDPKEGGVWSRSDAETLVKLHLGLTEMDLWAEWIGPPDAGAT